MNIYIYRLYIKLILILVERKNNNSLENLYREIYNNDHVVVCDVSSVCFYAMFLKKKVRVLLKDDNKSYLTNQTNNEGKKFTSYFKKKHPELFKKGLDPKKAIGWLVIIWGIDI